MKHGDSSANSSDERELPALEWMRRVRAEDELLREIRVKVKRRRARRLAAAGAMAVMICVGGFVLKALRPAAESSVETGQAIAVTATVSRPSLQKLPDGSTVELKDGAKVEIDFNGGFRRVRLTNGEAHFQVTKDKARPFIVSAGKVEVRAVGTAFSVQLASEEVDVLVTEGRVQVGADAAKEPVSAYVDAGGRCVIAADLLPRVETISSAEAGERLAWRVTQLEFSRTPLSEVVGLMNRHAPVGQMTRFEIADRELSAIKLTGFLRADNTEGLLRLLENNFQVRSERVGERIVLRRGQ